MQPEIDKVQLEIAKLQLERERRRHEAADTLRRGATAAGSTIGSAVKWVMWVVLGAVVGGAAGTVVAAFMTIMDTARRASATCSQYVGTDFLYRMGCEIGANQGILIFVCTLTTLYGAYQGHKIALGR